MSQPLTADVLDSLAEHFGSAFYLLDSDTFQLNYHQLLSAFRMYYPRSNIAYSYKTNYTPRFVRIVDRLGGYAEVVSDMELEIALRSGVDPKRIIWNGPIKNSERVNSLLLAGGTVNLDSIYEIHSIVSFSAAHPDHMLNIGIRCNYDIGDGVVSRFGFDVNGEEFQQTLQIIKDTPCLHLINLQAHFAKRAPEYWIARAAGMLDIYDRVREQFGFHPERLDIGGGIYGEMPKELRAQLGIGDVRFDDYAFRAAKLFAEHFSDDPNAPTLIVEPGSAIAGNSMRFVCRIETIKTVRRKAIATANGSQKNISMSGLNPPLTVVPCGAAQTVYCDLDIVGYTCIEGDILQKNYSGPLAVGDYLIFENCGSYSLVMKPPFIFPNCPVLDVTGSFPELIKRAETFDDLFCTYSFV